MVSANQVRQGVVDKLAVRAPEFSICPSEVARELGGDTWRELMPFVRETAAQMAREGTIVATQGDAVVDAEGAKGPIRLRRGPGLLTPCGGRCLSVCLPLGGTHKLRGIGTP